MACGASQSQVKMTDLHLPEIVLVSADARLIIMAS